MDHVLAEQKQSWRLQPLDTSWRGRFWIGALRLFCKILVRSSDADAGETPDIAAMRRRNGFLENVVANVPPKARFRNLDEAPVDGEWMSFPDNPPRRTLLYIHGGSFVLGRSAVHNALIVNITREADADAFVLDYRLAPEHPFPSGIEDVKTAYRWLIARGTDPSQVAIVADSAGGSLALGALVSLRDEGFPLPAATALLSPWVDMTLSGNSVLTNLDSDPIVSSLEAMNVVVRLYLQGRSTEEPLASPLFADLTGLPPTLIHVGAPEVLRDDGTRLAQSLRDAGCKAWCDVYPRMPHGWHALGTRIPETQRSITEIGEFLKEMMPDQLPVRH